MMVIATALRTRTSAMKSATQTEIIMKHLNECIEAFLQVACKHNVNRYIFTKQDPTESLKEYVYRY